MLGDHAPIRLPRSTPPRLLVVIDTEEEFEWSAPPDRNATGVTAMAKIERAQRIFDAYGIVPTYVVDYPVADQREGWQPLKEFQDDGRAVIGAHLHPWVNPPHDEALRRSNMYPGNLPEPTEEAKLRALTERIAESFGRRPTIYKAGRYGVGPNTTGILERLGYDVDLSTCPPVDYRADGGPDYSRAPCEPYWFGADDALLEIPITGAYVGWARGAAGPLYRLATREALRPLRLPGILSRVAALDRLMLSPEGFGSDEHLRLTRALHRDGVRTFTWSFHSPSVEPGHTPYVRSQADLDRFLDMFQRFFDFFFGPLGGVATTPHGLKDELEALR